VTGTTARVVVHGVAPGDSVCVTGAGAQAAGTANRKGTARVSVTVPAGFSKARFRAVDSAGRSDARVVRVR
jgi:hypothetical protein